MRLRSRSAARTYRRPSPRLAGRYRTSGWPPTSPAWSRHSYRPTQVRRGPLPQRRASRGGTSRFRSRAARPVRRRNSSRMPGPGSRRHSSRRRRWPEVPVPVRWWRRSQTFRRHSLGGSRCFPALPRQGRVCRPCSGPQLPFPCRTNRRRFSSQVGTHPFLSPGARISCR